MGKHVIDYDKGKVATLFRDLFIPTVLGTIAISFVTLVDGIFVGRGVGPDGVAAVNLSMPVCEVMSGIGIMVGVGCSVVCSIHLARGKVMAARQSVTLSLVATALLTVLFCAAVLWMPQRTARFLGASESLMPLVLDYLTWVLPCCLFEMWTMIGLMTIRLDGSPRYAMWCNVVPAVLNIGLDWYLIFVLGMGVRGAAIGTAVSISAGGLMAVAYLLFFADRLRLVPFRCTWRNARHTFRQLSRQCRIGSSALLGELTLAVLIFVGNHVFMYYLGDAGVGAFGIACYYTPFFFMVGNAIVESAQPIVSYNYGKGRWGEVGKARRLLLTTALAAGALIALLFAVFPEPLTALFVDTGSPAGQMAVEGFPYFAPGMLFFMLNIAFIGYFQSIEQVRRSLRLVFLRGLVLLVPCFLLLPGWLGVRGIWLAMPVAEALTVICAAVLCCRFHRRDGA